MRADAQPDRPWRRQLACTAELDRLPALLSLVRAACAHLKADAQAEHDLVLLAEEACVNVMRHAYTPGQAGPLLLRVQTRRHGDGHAVQLVLQDQGRPFNPLAAPLVDVDATVDKRAIGGLGVHLMRQLADRLHYRRDAREGNILTIEKYL
jgi:serine/threonine-protein kinase RsbW